MAASAPNSTSNSNTGWGNWLTGYLPWRSSPTMSASENKTAELASQITVAPSSGRSIKGQKGFHANEVQSVKMASKWFTGTGETDTYLDFSNNSKISDEELIIAIESNPLLQGLNLQGCYRLTEKSFAHLSTLTNLKYLNANYCTNVPVDALKNIPMNQMNHLELRGYSFDDTLISALFSDAPLLVYLDLSRYSIPMQSSPDVSLIGDDGFAVLSKLSNLQNLNLSYLQYNGNGVGLMALGGLENLTTLNMMMYAENVENEVEFYQMIGSMQNLRSWNPPMVLNHPESIQGLQNSKLEVLKYPWLSKNISDQLQYLPLTLQEFEYNPPISDRDTAFYAAMGRLINLRSLTINGTLDCNLTNQYWGNITMLEELNIMTLQNSLKTLCELNPSLRKISIDSGLHEDISPICGLPRLESLNIYGVDNPNLLMVELASQNPVPPLSVLLIGALNPSAPAVLVNEGIKALEAFAKTLTMVDINCMYNSMFDEKAAVASLSKLTELTNFSFQMACSIASCAEFIAPMEKLESLVISPEQAPSTTESPTPLFQAIGKLPHLSNLSILNCYGVGNSDFAYFAQNLKLKYLYLDGVGGSYNNDAVKFIETVRSLTTYSSICDGTAPISSEALAEMKENLHLQVCQSQLLPG